MVKQTEPTAKRAYREFVKKGISQGQRPELVGGDLIRSLGGWSVVKSSQSSGNKKKGDARILGSSEYVIQVMDEAEQNIRHQLSGNDVAEAAGKIIQRCWADLGLRFVKTRIGAETRQPWVHTNE